MKKTICCILCLCLTLLLFSGCQERYVVNNLPDDNHEKTPVAVSTGSLRLPYYSSDSLNPFYAETNANRTLMSLAFEPLFTIDSSFAAVPNVASGYSADGGKITVKLDMTSVFSDGVQISAADVVYSFGLAKKCSYYAPELSFISKAEALDTSTCVFTVSGNEINGVDSLNFPIVKVGSAGSISSIPVGTGCFKFVLDAVGAHAERNDYARNLSRSIDKIEFVGINDDSTFIHRFELGEIDAYFDDMSSGSYSTLGAITSKTILPNLVFLGINSSSFALNETSVRQALYYAINRRSIARNSFKNLASPSPTIFPSSWHITSSTQESENYNLNLDESIQKLKSAGVTGKLNYTMIVNSGNSFKVSCANEIIESLKSININVALRELTFSEYTDAMNAGQYDLYIGEVKIPTNMDMTSVLGPKTPIKGISAADSTMNAYTQFLLGKITLDAMNESFMANMPFVPICYRVGILVYSNKITPSPDCEYMNYFKNIFQWEIIDEPEESSESDDVFM